MDLGTATTQQGTCGTQRQERRDLACPTCAASDEPQPKLAGRWQSNAPPAPHTNTQRGSVGQHGAAWHSPVSVAAGPTRLFGAALPVDELGRRVAATPAHHEQDVNLPQV